MEIERVEGKIGDTLAFIDPIRSETGSMKNLAIKMIRIMGDASYIQKTGYNSFHRYKYATESDVASAFAKALKDHNVFMFSSILERSCETYKTRGNKDAFLITVKLQVTFVDGDSGESYTGTFYGDGSDSDDKGIYKAITGAQKYALMKTFLVETGDDPERDDQKPPNRTTNVRERTPVVFANKSQIEELRELFIHLGLTDERIANGIERAGATSLHDMEAKKIQAWIDLLAAKLAANREKETNPEPANTTEHKEWVEQYDTEEVHHANSH
jgi:hypothetical protein